MIKKYLTIIIILLASACICAQQPAEAPLAESENTYIEQEKTSLLQKVEIWYSNNMNYWSITALMAIESSFIPFPSEIVVPPAVYVAANESSDLNKTASYPLNVLIIVLFATFGALIGACINYGLSIWLGRPIIYKFADSKIGHLLLLSGEKIQKAEEYFNEHGKISTFIGRLIPAIRQLISIPAGLARMPFLAFLGYTFLGAFTWNMVLAIIGYVAHGQADLINRYNYELSIAILAIVGVAVLVWIIRKVITTRRARG